MRELSISVKIFYNGKLVSATPKSPLDLNFRVHIEETFSMQVTNRPESLMLEVQCVIVCMCSVWNNRDIFNFEA